MHSTSRLYRRADSPFWWAEYTTPDGFTVRQSTRCRDPKAAQDWLALRESERVRGEAGLPVARHVLLEDAVVEYLEQREKTWSPGYFATVDGLMRHQVIPWWQGTVRDITRTAVEDWRVKQISRPLINRRGTASTATVNRQMASLAAFGDWAQRRGYHTANPWAEHPPLPEDDKPVPSLEPSELARVLVAVGERWRLPLTFAVDTGLRKSELERVRWEDVHLDDRRLWVVSAYSRGGRTKSRKMRSVALFNRTVEILRLLPRRSDGFVFGPIGDPRRALKRAAKTVGLEHLWMHALRHIAATRKSRAGATIAEMMDAFGWTTPRMLRRYDHATHQRQVALADRQEEMERAPAVRAMPR